MHRPFLPIALAIAVALAAAACSQQNEPTPQQRAAAQKAATEAAARQKLVTYQKLLAMKNYTLAVPIGEEIVDKYPKTQAAAEVNKTLSDIRSEGEARAQKRRLEGLWLYQLGPMQGGTQSTATIHATKPADAGVRLVLRRHSKWGSSAFLYAADSSFVCKGRCRLPAIIDGKKHTLTGYLPNGGEPAMFIQDDKAFVGLLEKSKKMTLEVTMKGSGKRELVFEVGGFDAGKWKKL